jgi:hypothetical protein
MIMSENGEQAAGDGCILGHEGHEEHDEHMEGASHAQG